MDAWNRVCSTQNYFQTSHISTKKKSCPAWEYLHSERRWMLEKVSAALITTTIPQSPHISKNPQKKRNCLFVQFGQESCPAGKYLHSERLWMLEKVSVALNTTPTTIPQTPHIFKHPQKKKKGNAFNLDMLSAASKSLGLETVLSCVVHQRLKLVATAGLVVDLAT